MHTLLDLRGNIPVFIMISDGLVHDVNILDELIPELGSIYIMDRGYTGFGRLYNLDQLQAVFIIRARKNLQFRRIYSRNVDRSTGLICDQISRLTGIKPAKKYPDQRARCNHQEAAESGAGSLHYSTDIECYPLRESAHPAST